MSFRTNLMLEPADIYTAIRQQVTKWVYYHSICLQETAIMQLKCQKQCSYAALQFLEPQQGGDFMFYLTGPGTKSHKAMDSSICCFPPVHLKMCHKNFCMWQYMTADGMETVMLYMHVHCHMLNN